MENTVVLREWFHRVDSGRIGNITAPQLQSALSIGNLDFALSVVQQMIRMYDFDGSGTMRFEEILALNKFLQKMYEVNGLMYEVNFSTLESITLENTMNFNVENGRSHAHLLT